MARRAGGELMSLIEAQRALARCDWSSARELLEGATGRGPADEAERLDGLGESLWWLGQIEQCIDARQQAYALFDEQGLSRRAGQTAIWLYEHYCFLGRPAMAGGWLRRARRALESHVGCVEWGNLLLREAEQAHGAGDRALALDNATIALDLGRRLRSCDLEGEALQTAGRILIDDGHPRVGIAHLDEAMLLAVEGRLGPYATGKVYCSLIGACEDVGDLRRAAEWTDATARWSEQHPFAVFPGLCRVKRAEVLQWRGNWVQAEREARRACEELAAVKVGTAAAAWVEVGEIRRRIGDLAGAEEAFDRAQEMGCIPSSGLALLRLAQNRAEAATSIIDNALGDAIASSVMRARLLPAKVQVSIAVGDLAGADAAASELERIAEQYESDLLSASAHLCRGRVQLATGDQGGCASFRRASELWQRLDVPYETATAQLLLSEACRDNGDRTGETSSLTAAVATFERLGAAYDARPAGRVTSSSVVLPCGITEREAEVLRLVAKGRTNKDIASELALSQKTVARHVSNILAKTGLPTRSAATAFAFERGIVGARS